MKRASDGLVRKLDKAEERISEPQASQQKPPKLKSKDNKDWRQQNGKSKDCGTTAKGVTDPSREHQKEKKERKEQKNTRNNSDWEFPQIKIRHQNTDLGSSENTK